MRLELYATAARSDINSRLLTFARPPGPRFRGPRLDTAATSAVADLIEDVIGLAVRSIVLRRVTEDIIANVEIDPPSGENVEWQGVGVPLCRAKNIDPSRKPPFIYRSNASNSRDNGVSDALWVGGR